MRAHLHRLLLLCLMLALPLQGYAAASMLSCALAHGGVPAAVEAATPCHQSAEPEPSPERHDCAHCAMCMLASALPIPVVAALPADATVRAYGIRPPASMATHLPDGLERPPQPALA